MDTYAVTLNPLPRLGALPGFFSQRHERVKIPLICDPGRRCPVVVQNVGDPETTPDPEERRRKRYFWMQYLPWGFHAEGPTGAQNRTLMVAVGQASENPVHAECLRSLRCLVPRGDRMFAGIYTDWRSRHGTPGSLGFHTSSEAFALLTEGGEFVALGEKDWLRWLDVETPQAEVRDILANWCAVRKMR